MDFVFVDELTMPQDIIVSIAHRMLAKLGHTDTIWWWQHLALRTGDLVSRWLILMQLCANYVLTPTHWRVAIFLFVLMIWKLRIVQRDMAMLGSSL
jgi:hypothetical protein